MANGQGRRTAEGAWTLSPRVCTICTHPEHEAIDAALVSGAALAALSRDYGLSEDALGRHKATHLPAAVVKAQDAAEIVQADSLLQQVDELKTRATRLADAAEKDGQRRTAIVAVREMRGIIELLAKLQGQLDDRPQINLLVSPQWHETRAALLLALQPFPEAREAVSGRLVALEASTS